MMATSLKLLKNNRGLQKKVQKRKDSKSTQTKRILTNHEEQNKRNRDRRNARRDASSRRRSQVSGTDDHFRGPGNHRGAARDTMRLVRIRQTSTRTDIPILLTTTQIALIRRCCATNNNVPVPAHEQQQIVQTMNTTTTIGFHS